MIKKADPQAGRTPGTFQTPPYHRQPELLASHLSKPTLTALLAVRQKGSTKMYRSARHFVYGLLAAALTFFAFPAQGAVQTNIKVPVSITVDISCAGETIELSGNLHILFLLTPDAGGGLLLKSHFQPQGISGFGLTTGVKYQATGETQEETHFKALPFEDTFVNNFKIIGQGPGNNLLIHENFHIAVNGKGIVTVLHDNVSVGCK